LVCSFSKQRLRRSSQSKDSAKGLVTKVTYCLVENSPVVNPAYPLELNVITKTQTDLGPLEIEAGKGRHGVLSRIHDGPKLIKCLGPLVLHVCFGLAFESFEDME
jgi:hypothetical protein